MTCIKTSIWLCLLLFIGMNTSCEAPNEPAQTGPQVVDIEDFLSNEYKKLAEKGTFKKKVIVKDSAETKTVQLSEKEWKQELRFFTNSNINRKSWVDYLQIDTQYLDNGAFKITYTTEREKIPVKKAVVEKNAQGEIQFLSLKISRSNPISALDRKLVYAFPDSILIKNTEELWLVSDQHVKILYSWPDSIQ